MKDEFGRAPEACATDEGFKVDVNMFIEKLKKRDPYSGGNQLVSSYRRPNRFAPSDTESNKIQQRRKKRA